LMIRIYVIAHPNQKKRGEFEAIAYAMHTQSPQIQVFFTRA
jgi:hypothetical protein